MTPNHQTQLSQLFGAPSNPGEELCYTVILAVSALVAITDSASQGQGNGDGMYNVVRFIACGLQDAVLRFESQSHSSTSDSQGAES